MFNVNKSKYHTTLLAISNIDSQAKDKKCCETFNKNNLIYWVINQEQFNVLDFSRRMIYFFQKQKEAINIDINSFFKLIDEKLHYQILISILSASELFNETITFKTNIKHQIINNFIINNNEKMIKLASLIIDAQNWAKKMIVLPHNHLNVKKFIDEIKIKLKDDKISIKTLSSKQIKDKGMNLICSVGNSSNKEDQPTILNIEYCSNKNLPKIALIGKGIMSDTGGLNIKTGNYMKNMNTDMAGAAIAASIIYALAKLKINANVNAILALTTNDIGPNAYRMNDVIKSYSGKTIEITNTDAEGRLILADAITYANKDLNANIIITIATLTGAISVSLGSTYTGFWSNDEGLANKLIQSAFYGCENIWRMPFNFEYLSMLKSNIADYINCSDKRDASSSVAAEFLKIFAKPKKFIHLDIAGSSEISNNVFTPIMIRTLIEFIKNNK